MDNNLFISNTSKKVDERCKTLSPSMPFDKCMEVIDGTSDPKVNVDILKSWTKRDRELVKCAIALFFNYTIKALDALDSYLNSKYGCRKDPADKFSYNIAFLDELKDISGERTLISVSISTTYIDKFHGNGRVSIILNMTPTLSDLLNAITSEGLNSLYTPLTSLGPEITYLTVNSKNEYIDGHDTSYVDLLKTVKTELDKKFKQ